MTTSWELFATIASAVAAVLAAAGALRAWWQKTLGRRRWASKALRRLGTNAQVEYFTRVLGSPPAIREEHEVPFKTFDESGASIVVREGVVRCVWVDPDFLVCAIVNSDGGVDGYSITTRTRRFKPSLPIAGSGSERPWRGKIARHLPEETRTRLFDWWYPPTRVRLGKSRFSALASKPVAVSAWVSLRSFQYQEVHYFGNPGNYLHYVLAVIDSGRPLRWTTGTGSFSVGGSERLGVELGVTV